MRRTKAFKRGPTVPVLLAGAIGYLIGAWHPAAIDGDPPADKVALRFPQEWNMASPASGGTGMSTAAAAMPTASVINAGQLALFNPEPMVPQIDRQAAPQPAQNAGADAPMQTAARETVVSSPTRDAGESMHASSPAAAARAAAPTRTPLAAARRPVNDRPGYVLDDAQIASIKERLHLTPNQERMWPAVEGALRNIAYARAQAARRPGVPDGAADPDPDAVASLKSAAVPLIMSFDDEQKQEVRSLAHVMGLDRLASQF